MKLVPILVLAALTASLTTAQTVRAGTFYKAAVVVAFYRSPLWADALKAKQAELAAAGQANDTQKAQDLDAWGNAQQDLAHRQLEGAAPIANILDALAPQLPDIARKAGVVLIAPDLPYTGPNVQTIDLTELLLDCLHADQRTRDVARDLRNPARPSPR